MAQIADAKALNSAARQELKYGHSFAPLQLDAFARAGPLACCYGEASVEECTAEVNVVGRVGVSKRANIAVALVFEL